MRNRNEAKLISINHTRNNYTQLIWRYSLYNYVTGYNNRNGSYMNRI